MSIVKYRESHYATVLDCYERRQENMMAPFAITNT